MADIKVYATKIDEKTLSQVDDMANCEAYKDCKIRIQADAHAGSGSCIGFTSTIAGKVIPNTVGVDISCGMSVVELGKIDIDLPKFNNQIQRSVPTGFSIRRNVAREFAEIEAMHCFDKLPKKTRKEYNQYIGTLGGGNHFIELDSDENGNVFLVVHSGSRNLGKQVCEYYQDLAVNKLQEGKRLEIQNAIDKLKAEGQEHGINEAIKELENKFGIVTKDMCYLDGEDLEHYLSDSLILQEYARLNRLEIINQILTNYFYGDDVKVSSSGRVKIKNKFSKIDTEIWESVHNYIGEDRIIRKGSIAAYEGQRVIIPINMRDGVILGIGKSNADYNFSAPHGAGRVLSRTQADADIDLSDFKKTMEGIYSTCVCEATLDESPFAYKSADDILPNITDTVDVTAIIKPILNFKDTSAKQKWKKK
jgi:RNA-splicing ligase RtcB